MNDTPLEELIVEVAWFLRDKARSQGLGPIDWGDMACALIKEYNIKGVYEWKEKGNE